jgi:anti-anti-sigma regulatory factor/DNA-binding NarL/FixJ family response regulator
MSTDHIRVLLVEDGRKDARLIQTMLGAVTSVAFEVEYVDRLSGALKSLDQGDIDVVLLDLSLPDSQGLDTFTKIQAKAPNVPAVVMTGLDDELVATKAVKKGAQDYLIKGQVDQGLLARSLMYAIERQQAQEELRRSEEKLRQTVEKLRVSQEALSTPVVQIWDKVLALPLIGVIDDERAKQIMEILLNKIVDTRSEMIIVDVTAVASIDTHVANHLIQTIESVSLLGARCILTGIQPQIAQTMTNLGMDMSKITVKRDMQDGLRWALHNLGYA